MSYLAVDVGGDGLLAALKEVVSLGDDVSKPDSDVALAAGQPRLYALHRK